MLVLRPRSLVLLALVLTPACGGGGDSGEGGSGDETGTTTDSTGGPGTGAPTDTSADPGSSGGTTSTGGEATGSSGDTTGGAEPGTTTTVTTGALDTGSSSTGEPPAIDPVIVAVGYGGMRVRSLDDGFTWTDYVQIIDDGGDDKELLRGVAWGAERFVAVGWKIFSSPDGVEWTEQENPTSQWYGAVQYGNDMFLAVGGGGYCARSGDGLQWEACTDATDDDGFTHVRSTLFLDGLFYTADAKGVLRSSPDGGAWSVVDDAFGSANAAVVDGVVAPLPEDAPAELVNARLRGGGTIERADPGSDRFMPVYTVPNDNNVFQAYRFAYALGYPQCGSRGLPKCRHFAARSAGASPC